jgi:hypothetical protein
VRDPIEEVLALAARLSSEAVAKLFARYGRPLEDPAPELAPEVLLSDGVTRLGRLSHRAPVDVIANDHFVLVRAGTEPLAMPGPLFAAAVAALTRTPSS